MMGAGLGRPGRAARIRASATCASAKVSEGRRPLPIAADAAGKGFEEVRTARPGTSAARAWSLPRAAPREHSPNRIDKSVLALGEARRIRDKEHLKHVASRPCLICGRQPSEPHHVRFAQKLAFGRKVSDEFTVPLCRLHHRELHRSRNEPQWWKTARIDPLPIARALWETTRPKATPLPVSAASDLAPSVLPIVTPPTNEVPKDRKSVV